MPGSVIGIRVADGSFFPVFERAHKGRKRLVLTTVYDEQDSVQIDLYQGDGRAVEDAEYIGSLVVANIPPAPRGEPEINLVLGIDAEGNLNATATDTATGEYESLSVSLESLEEELPGTPDFELEERGEGAGLEDESLEDLGLDEDLGESFGENLEDTLPRAAESPPAEKAHAETSAGTSVGAAPSEAGSERGEEAPIAWSRPADGQVAGGRRRHTLLFVAFMILSLAALTFLVYFVFRMVRAPELPPLEARLEIAGVGGPAALAGMIRTRLRRTGARSD
ncbi:MAG: Hsp70 family protein [Spirochaetaceae bacterium]